MRIAVISDIHGNAHALEAVLEDIAGQAPDLTVNLGDHLSGPFNAGRTADMLLAADFPSVKGNHDRFLVEPPKGEHGKLEKCALATLTARHLDWVRTLPATRVVADEVFLCHAIPTDDGTNWLDAFDDNGIVVPRSLERVEDLAAGTGYPVMLCGHTHVPRMVMLSGGRLVINPGSVGYPGFKFKDGRVYAWSAGTPHARYAVIEKSRAGWSGRFHAVPYDTAAAAAGAEEMGMPEVAIVLRTGWLPDEKRS